MQPVLIAVGVPNPCVYTHTYERPCKHVKDPVVHVKSSMDYGNMKITSMVLYPQRQNVAEELKTVPLMEERGKNNNTKTHYPAASHGPQTPQL